MSFSYDVKKELCGIPFGNICCVTAESYAFLLFSREFSLDSILFKTENGFIAERYASLLFTITGVEAKITPPKKEGGMFTLTVDDETDREAIITRFGHTGHEPMLRINRAMLYDECCFPSFIRGAFLACGSVSNPENDYHFEFMTSRQKLSTDLSALIGEYITPPKLTLRKSTHVLYYKESERIEEILTFMGATVSTLTLMNIKVYKEMRNRVNRTTNCVTANITRTTEAVRKQMAAIDLIDKKLGLEILPAELFETAIFRRDNPEMSLSELGSLLCVPLSRSGVNHRLQRIIEFAEKLN